MQRSTRRLRGWAALLVVIWAGSGTGVARGQVPLEAAAREARIDSLNRHISEFSQALNRRAFRICLVDVARSRLKRAARSDVREAMAPLEAGPSEDGLRRFCNSLLVDAEAHVRPYAEARVIYSAEGMKEEVAFDLLPVRAALPAVRAVEVRSEIAGQLAMLQIQGTQRQAALYPAGGVRLSCRRDRVFLCEPLSNGGDLAVTGDGLVTLTQRGVQGDTKSVYNESLQQVMSREVMWSGTSDVLIEQHMRGVAAVVGSVKIPRLSWRAEYSEGLVSALSVFLIEVLPEEKRGQQLLAIPVDAGVTLVDFRDDANTPNRDGPRNLGVLESASNDVARQIADVALKAGAGD